MTIPRLNGWFDEIRPYVNQAVGTIHQKLYPNQGLQLAMQQEVAKNPALLQQFADLSKRDPDLLKRMGLDNINMMIGNIPESAGSIKERKTAGYLQTPDTPQDVEELTAGAKGVQTPTQRRIQENTATLGGLNIDAAKDDATLREYLKPFWADQAALTGEETKAKLQEFGEYLTGKNALKKLANKYENMGLLDENEQRILSTNPRLSKDFERIRDDYWLRWREEQQNARSNRDRSANRELTFMSAWANQVAQYGGTTPLAAYNFAHLDPDEAKRLINSTAPGENDDPTLWAAAQGVKKLQGKQDISVTRMISNELYKDPAFAGAMRILSNQKPGNKQAALQIANDIAASKAKTYEITNPPVWELKDTPGWFFTKKVPTLVSGDFSLAKEIAQGSNMEFNTPNEQVKVEQDAKLLQDDKAMDTLAEALAKDIAASPKDKDTIISNFTAKNPVIAAEVRKRLNKYVRP